MKEGNSGTVAVCGDTDRAGQDRRLACTEEIKRQLRVQKQRYPLMTEADTVKFVFQGMLGVGHLVRSEQAAKERLLAEMAGLEPDGTEPLVEKISTDWARVNLRAAMAKEIPAEEIARRLVLSAETQLFFTRQDVYALCMELDGSGQMRAAAAKVTDESWLPGHSEQYRAAYHPAYRVLYKDFCGIQHDAG